MLLPDHSAGVILRFRRKAATVIRRTYSEAVANQVGGRRLLRRWRKRLYYVWIALCHRRPCRDWYDFLDSPPVQPFLAVYPALPLKPLKPYLSLSLDIRDRIRVIQDSLLLLSTRWESLRHIITGQNPVIATIDLGPDGAATLCLEYNHQKEGELSLLLRMTDGRVAAMSTFAFDRKPGGDHVMRIGRIQGVKDHELLRSLEKAMHGLRPKSLMLFASQEFSRVFGVKEIFGVSNAYQVYKRKVLIPIPGLRKLSFDYDGFWSEAGGKLEPDGWFRLPPSLEKRTLSEIKPNKRSMYKKRYAMLDNITDQIFSSGIQETPQ
jgi:uncharacterized protein VirK/YbjX